VNRQAASPREAAPAQVCALWLDLLARLSLAAVASTQVQTHLLLRALGVRRTGTVATNLARELSVAYRMAAFVGVMVEPLELQRRVGELAHPGTLESHLRGVTTAYQLIMFDPATPPQGPLSKWLAGQQRVHLTQIESIENLSHPTP
jgi:hypothetical protein